MYGGWGITEPYPTVMLVFSSNFLSNFEVFQRSSTIFLLTPKNEAKFANFQK